MVCAFLVLEEMVCYLILQVSVVGFRQCQKFL